MAVLNAKQKAFVNAYLAHKNATEAAIQAGYSKSRSVAQVQGHRLLRKAMIKAAIDRGLERQSTKFDLKAEQILNRIKSFALSDTIKASDALKACELLGKHFKLFTDVLEHGGQMPGVSVTLVMPSNGSEAKKEK